MDEADGMVRETVEGFCGDAQPHAGHEYYQGAALRRFCPGVESSRELLAAISMRDSAMKYLESREEILARVAMKHRRAE